MQPFKPTDYAEHRQQEALRRLMKSKGWITVKTHGNKYVSGWPDLYAHHPEYGERWIECKRNKRSKLKRGQPRVFERWSKFGIRIWVLRGPDDYELLFEEPNWRDYLTRPKGSR